MRRTDIVRTTVFRWTLGIAGIVALSIAVIAGFFYWQTVGYLTLTIDRNLLADIQFFAVSRPAERIARIDEVLSADPRRRKAYALFGPDGSVLAGNVPVEPKILPPPGAVAELNVVAVLGGVPQDLTVRAVAVRLDDGTLLFIGRVADLLNEIKAIITRAMALAIVPTVLLALSGGALVSTGTLRRVEAVRRACLLIMEGHLDRRLPVRSKRDEFDRLSEIVNRMLDDIERLMAEAKGAGDAIAHDLRTPLTRVRARLERALASGGTCPDKVPVLLEKSIADIDQLLTTVTAILRIAEVEQSRRRSGFGMLDLDDIVTSVSELYAPIAEEKGIVFSVLRHPVPELRGDGDLIFEAVANLVDNSVKFTPEGGRVEVRLSEQPEGVSVSVRDSGPGIPPEERESVLRRFYRADRSRSQPGTGLGLTLVVAVVRLHGFGLTLADAPGGGCDAAILCKADAELEATTTAAA